MILAVVIMATVGLSAVPKNEDPKKCGQSAVERTPLLREAIAERYTLRRIEFAGNETIPDYVVRRRVSLREGDFYNHRNLTKSIEALSKLKLLNPVRMDDVIIQLDKSEKLVDLTFCLRERHSRRRGAS